MKITVLVDNYITKRNFIAEHGFSLLIETNGGKILFDTGQGYALKNNLDVLKIDPHGIDFIVLSHGHDDHTGGLKFFIEEKVFPRIIAHPDVVLPKYKVESGKKENIGLKYSLGIFHPEFFKGPRALDEKIVFSGEVPKVNQWELEETKYFREVNEQLEKDPFTDDVSLFVPTNKGLVVLTGCAHSGIINIIQYGLEITHSDHLRGIIGGMHLKNASQKRIEKTVSILKELNPEFITVSHCTGLEAGVVFKSVLKDKVIFTSVGMSFSI